MRISDGSSDVCSSDLGRGVTALARALSRATQQRSATSDTPRLDAELLMAHALDIERDSLLLSKQDQMVPAMYPELVERRRAGEPVAYIKIGRASGRERG